MPEPMARDMGDGQDQGAAGGPSSPGSGGGGDDKPPPNSSPRNNLTPLDCNNTREEANESQTEEIPLPDPAAEGFIEESVEASAIFGNFVQQQMEREEVPVGPEIQSYLERLPSQTLGSPSIDEADGLVRNRINATWAVAGRELRQIADVFSRSRERQKVRERARSVNIQTLTRSHFMAMLQELFDGEGVTTERLLILFFFCADVAIEAVRHGWLRCFYQLTSWAANFIATCVASWVHAHGGWVVVLHTSLDWFSRVGAFVAYGMIVVACVTYIRKNWR